MAGPSGCVGRSAPRLATCPAPARCGCGVDRPNQQTGFFDNMANRPIRDANWREHSIEGAVDGDATNVAFGVMASGGVIADFDAIELAVREADGRWTVLAIKDAGFEAAAGNGSGEWMRAGTSTDAGITRPADQAPRDASSCDSRLDPVPQGRTRNSSTRLLLPSAHTSRSTSDRD